MKTVRIIRRPYVLLSTSLVLACSSLAAQDASDEGEIVELSPFTVETSDDSGYYAASTLAGSRLNSSLRDVAASITVVTPEFLDDIAADDIENAMVYVAGVETDLVTDTSAVVGGYLEASPSSSNNRVRGLSSADVTMDFFQVGNANLDRYNIERITLIRGPNSVLFGLGSPAGILDYTSKKANVRKDSGEFAFRVDSFGGWRTSVDYNKSIVKDKLAIRLMGLYEKGKFQFDDAYDNDKRITVALTAKPFKSTTIRMNVEKGRNDSRRPRYLPPQDNVSGWIAAGSPIWDPVAYEGKLTSDIYTDDAQAKSFRELDGVANNPFVAYTDMNAIDPDFASYLRNVDSTGTNLTPSRIFYRSANPEEDAYEYDQQVSDERIFPFQDVDINLVGQGYNKVKDDKFVATVEQRVTRDLAFELGYYKDRFIQDNYGQIMNQTAAISVDVNKTLPNGQPNPNFLRPFVFGRGLGSHVENETSAFRATVSYEFDFGEKFDNFLKYFGKHRFAGIYSQRDTQRFLYRWEPKLDQMNGPAITTDLQSANHRVAQIYYVGDPIAAGQQFPTFTGFPTDRTGPLLDRPFALDYFDTEAGVWSVTDPIDGVEPTTVRLQQLVHNPPTNRNKSEVEGYGASWQSFFLDGRIVTTIGWRTDEISSWTIDGPPPGDNGLVPLDLSLDGWQFPEEPSSEPQSGDTLTKGIVVAPLNWLRLHYNESENFEVTAQKVNIFREPIPPSGGDGKDWGFSMDLLKNRLHLKVNWFETAQVNADTGAFGFTSSWGVQSVERQLYGYLNRNGRLAEWKHPLGDKDPNNPEFDANYLKPNNVGDVNDFVSKGTEVEVIYNPTQSWRIAFNVTKVETVQANSAADLIRYRDMRLPYLQQFFDEMRNPSQTWGEWYWIRIGKPLANAEAANGKVSTALARWSANLVTNYQFREGSLKGFFAGAAVRWREGATIGYPDIEVDGIVRSDLDNPISGPALFNVGLHGGYSRKILDGKVNWRIQVNIQNLIGDDDMNAIRANANGRVAAWRVGRDRYVQLTNTFRF